MSEPLYKPGDMVMIDDDRLVIIIEHLQLKNGNYAYNWFIPAQAGGSPEHLIKQRVGSLTPQEFASLLEKK